MSPLCCAARAIADEVVQAEATRRAASASSTSPARHRYPGSEHALIIDAMGASSKSTGSVCALRLSGRAAHLKKDPRGFGAAVKQLYTTTVSA